MKKAKEFICKNKEKLIMVGGLMVTLTVGVIVGYKVKDTMIWKSLNLKKTPKNVKSIDAFKVMVNRGDSYIIKIFGENDDDHLVKDLPKIAEDLISIPKVQELLDKNVVGIYVTTE